MTNAPVAADAVIRVTDLKKHYGDVHAVDGVTFEVRPRRGLRDARTQRRRQDDDRRVPRGSSRARQWRGPRARPRRGEGRRALKERIGVSLQTAALYPKLTVTEPIDLFRSFYPKSRPTAELIEALGLTERSKAQSKDLSGGQRQRLSVALALVNDPELVFLDEPTTGLDPAARRSLWTLVEGLKAAGTSVLLTTHYMEEAEILCDRLAIMDHGKVLELGTVEELVSKHFKDRAVRFDPDEALDTALLESLPAVSSVHVDDTDALVFTRDVGATIGALLAAAEGRGVEPQNLSIRRASLEDVFLSLTGRALRD